MEEIDNYEWVALEGFPDYYICKEGLVKSCKGKEPIILKPHRGDIQGHLNMRVYNKEGKLKEVYLHRLLAQTFIPNPNNLPVVRHLNDIPDDNRLENLAWGTQLDNMHDSMRNGTKYSFTEESRNKAIDTCRRKFSKPTVFIKDKKRYEFNSLKKKVVRFLVYRDLMLQRPPEGCSTRVVVIKYIIRSKERWILLIPFQVTNSFVVKMEKCITCTWEPI